VKLNLSREDSCVSAVGDLPRGRSARGPTQISLNTREKLTDAHVTFSRAIRRSDQTFTSSRRPCWHKFACGAAANSQLQKLFVVCTDTITDDTYRIRENKNLEFLHVVTAAPLAVRERMKRRASRLLGFSSTAIGLLSRPCSAQRHNDQDRPRHRLHLPPQASTMMPESAIRYGAS